MDRSLLGCGPWGHKELDMTERLTLLLSLVVQWLRLCTLNAEGLDSISGQGTRSHTLQRKIQNSETETQRSLVAQTVKNPPAMQETWLRFLGQEDAMKKQKATHSSIFAWRIPWTEELGRLQFLWSQRIGHDLATKQQYVIYDQTSYH